MWIAESLLFAGPARQKPEEVAAAGKADEAKYPAPEAPRLRIQAEQRQSLVETSLGLMHYRALSREGPAALGRSHGQQHRVGLPLDVDIAEAGRRKDIGRAGFHLPQKNVRGCRLRARKLPCAGSQFSRRKHPA